MFKRKTTFSLKITENYSFEADNFILKYSFTKSRAPGFPLRVRADRLRRRPCRLKRAVSDERRLPSPHHPFAIRS